MFLNEQKTTIYCSEFKTLMLLNVASRAADRGGAEGGATCLGLQSSRAPRNSLKWRKVL